MTAIAESAGGERKTQQSRISMVISPITAMLYPLPLIGFHAVVTAANADPSTNWAATSLIAAVLLIAAFACPVIAWRSATHFSRIAKPSVAEIRARRVAFLAVAAPAFFSFIGTTVFMLGAPGADVWLLGAFWAAMAAFVATGGSTPYVTPTSNPEPASIRVVHGLVALAVILVFLGLHLANHLIGLIGPDTHKMIMKVLRHFYRAPIVEPLLIAGFAVLIATGGYMAWRLTRTAGDGFRAFQITTGIYLIFFIVSHTSAVFVLARSYLGIDTDWGFATGAPTGLILDAWNIRLVPLYALAVFCAVAHPLAGARVVLLSHGVRREVADAVVVWGAAGAGLLSSVIMLGMCGLRMHFA
jgi:hypothetical protein